MIDHSEKHPSPTRNTPQPPAFRAWTRRNFLSLIEEQLSNLKRQGLEGLIAERLLAQEAARRGVSVAALLEAEVTAKAAPVTDEEVDIYYHANKARRAGDERTIRQNVRPRLRQQSPSALLRA
jgi:hypothetical protein